MEPTNIALTRQIMAQIFAWDLSFSDTPGSWSNVINRQLNAFAQPHVFENLEICELEQEYDSLLNHENGTPAGTISQNCDIIT